MQFSPKWQITVMRWDFISFIVSCNSGARSIMYSLSGLIYDNRVGWEVEFQGGVQCINFHIFMQGLFASLKSADILPHTYEYLSLEPIQNNILVMVFFFFLMYLTLGGNNMCLMWVWARTRNKCFVLNHLLNVDQKNGLLRSTLAIFYGERFMHWAWRNCLNWS